MGNFGNERNLYDIYASDSKVLSGMFCDPESTDNAYNKLLAKGYSIDEISLVMSDRTREKDFNYWKFETEFDSKVDLMEENDFAKGETLGTVAGKFAALSTTMVIHGLGILITGPLASDMANAEENGLVGGLIGAFVRSGIPESRARSYYSGIKKGNVVIILTPKDEADGIYLLDNWKNNRGEEVYY